MIEVAMIYVKSEDLAEDVVQDVLYRVYLLGEDFHPKGSVIAYLFAAVRNAALSIVRHTHVQHGYEARLMQEALEFQRGVAWPEELGSIDDRSLALERALRGLSEHQRTALKLRYEQGLSIAQVAEILDISEKGAEKLLSRVTKLLRDRLRRAR